MVGTSNIYVSVTEAPDHGHGTSYRKAQHIWMLSVEPHPVRVPGMPHKDPEPIHYGAARDEESGHYKIEKHSLMTTPAILGNILIVESTHSSADQIHKVIVEALGSSSSTSSSKDASGDDPEQWIKKAMKALHEHKIGEPFDLDEFLMFARGYEANRIDKEAPALIAYPKVHKDHEKKASKHKFWITHPMASHTRTDDKGEASVYGGLM